MTRLGCRQVAPVHGVGRRRDPEELVDDPLVLGLGRELDVAVVATLVVVVAELVDPDGDGQLGSLSIA